MATLEVARLLTIPYDEADPGDEHSWNAPGIHAAKLVSVVTGRSGSFEGNDALESGPMTPFSGFGALETLSRNMTNSLVVHLGL